MYRDLLVHVDADPDGRGRVQFALDLAARTGARLHGLHVTPPADAPPMYKPSVVSGVAARMTSDLALDALAAAAIFSEEAGPSSVSSSWSQSAGDVARGISDRARCADLVILGQYEWQGSPHRHPLPIAHSVVLQCGRPVIVVPENVQSTELARIGVAWDGSREAVRAIHDALPLLHQAKSVQIVTMLPHASRSGEIDAKDLSAHLLNHGAKVEEDVVRLRTSTEHDSLRNRLEEGHYDLLVMGGYSHPMWLEFIFGGASQSILLSSRTPVLVSH